MAKKAVKVTKWNGSLLKRRITSIANKLLDDIAKDHKDAIRANVRVDTGNLRDATVIEKQAVIGNKMGRNVGTDEDQAPYAPYVYYPAGQHGLNTKTNRKRKWAGDDWITRSVQKTKSKTQGKIKKAEQDIKNIKL